MSKKKQHTQKQQNVESASYKLNTKAVDRLVDADKKTYSNNNIDPGKPYRSNGFIDSIPSPVKALFIKFWFNGAVCFFIYMGLGIYVQGLDMLLVMTAVLGMVNDLLVNNAFHFFAVTPGSNNKWMMFPQRKFWTFFANIVYSFIVLVCVMGIYYVIFNYIHFIGNDLRVEPILFGLFYMAVDMLFISIKNLVIKTFKDAKEKTDK